MADDAKTLKQSDRASLPPWEQPDFDDSPEWTDADFARARPARDVMTELFGTEATAAALDGPRRRGRPKAARTKVPVSIRLSADVLEQLRATGAGWQARADDILRAHFETAE